MTTRTIKTTVEVTDDRLRDLLTTAFEGGIGYWAGIVGYKDEQKYEGPLKYTEHEDPRARQGGAQAFTWPRYSWLPLVDGGAVVLTDIEENDINDPDETWILNRESIEKGLQVMTEKYNKHFSDFINENDDADTGDVFVQCCLFGELVYG